MRTGRPKGPIGDAGGITRYARPSTLGVPGGGGESRLWSGAPDPGSANGCVRARGGPMADPEEAPIDLTDDQTSSVVSIFHPARRTAPSRIPRGDGDASASGEGADHRPDPDVEDVTALRAA